MTRKAGGPIEGTGLFGWCLVGGNHRQCTKTNNGLTCSCQKCGDEHGVDPVKPIFDEELHKIFEDVLVASESEKVDGRKKKVETAVDVKEKR